MTIPRRSVKRIPGLKELRRKGREENLNPADEKFYPGKRPVKGGAVAKGFNALAVPKWHRYSLMKYGAPFNYQGTRTRRYSSKSLMALFEIEYRSLMYWIEKGQLLPPFLKVERSNGTAENYWLYHQIAPLYIWYKHLKARGLKHIKPSEADIKVLSAAYKRAERKWHNLLGEDYADPYTKVAGKYGVIWTDNTEVDPSPF